MNKFDDILNEVVYQIDDIIYSFYARSNEFIATKGNQEQLLDFRDKTIATINDMNVRSLEIISEFRSEALVRERTEHLLAKNQNLVDSAMKVIINAPDKNEFFDGVQNVATGLYESAKDALKKVDESGVVDRFVEKANEGLKKVQEGFDEFSNHPSVKRGAEVVKEKTKEAVDFGTKVVQDGAKYVSDLVDANTKTNDPSSVYESTETIYKEVEPDLQDVIDEVTEHEGEEKSDKEV